MMVELMESFQRRGDLQSGLRNIGIFSGSRRIPEREEKGRDFL